MEAEAPRRPSLYTAIRLARIIQHVRERLKARVLTRARKNALEVVEDYSVEKVYVHASDSRACREDDADDESRWRENMIVHTRATPATVQKSRKPHKSVAGRSANFAGLLQDFDGQVSSRGTPLTVVAARDQLFLSQDAIDLGYKHLQDISHVLDISTLLIERVQLARIERIWESPDSKCIDALECQKYLANLEHLLLCFQQAALEALINHSLNKLRSDYQHWDQYLEQQKKVHNGCFSEWAGGRPPLNSTMPWNIKPSLVVLWGVCWMFYNNTHDNSVSPQGVRQPRNSEGGWGQEQQRQQHAQWAQDDMQSYGFQQQPANNRPAQIRRTPPHHPNIQVSQAQIDALGSTGLGLHVTAHNTSHGGYQSNVPAMSQSHELSVYRGAAESSSGASSFASEPHQLANAQATLPAQQGPQSGPSSSLQHQKSVPYIRTSNITPSSSSDASFTTHSPAWPQQGQSSTQHFNAIWQPGPDTTNISTPARNFTYPHSAVSVTSHAPFSDFTPTSSGQNFYPRFVSAQPGFSNSQLLQLGVPMDNPQNTYPSPHSEGTGRAPSLSVAPMDQISPQMAHEGSPSDYSPTMHTRRDSLNREPPRNQMGQIYCDHNECASNQPTFSRKCEWTKHMDKHTRPYVCHQPGCEKIRGFTYSGGLLRHEREVHKKYGGPKAPRFCPHKDCKRSTGSGFSRKENLHEHLRRVHRGVGIEGDDVNEAVKNESAAEAEGASAHGSDTGLRGLGEGAERKRKKGSEEAAGLDELEELKNVNKRLRMELAQKDQRLKFLEDIVMKSMGTGGMGRGQMG